ncbi:LysM peptidoglycan-binding domain-containing protein [Margalitia sp. FSL K6-0131]|uniref:C40 family peptidase n=1 Tax=Margalitia sp. FSL K6-0131 TaxID=2954604 RepID=UPI0030F85302
MKKTIVSVAATTIIASAFTSQAFAATYKVKKGDSLSSIAYKYDTTINQLKVLNKLKSDLIFPNQVLTVSKGTTKVSASSVNPVKTYKVKAGDTLSGIASKNKVKLSDLLAWNKLKATSIIYPGDVIKLSKGDVKVSASSVTPVKTVSTPKPSTAVKTYKVKAGDTLSGIASKNKVKLSDLLAWNKLKATSVIYPGQVIQLSKGTSTTSTTKKPTSPTKTETSKTPPSASKPEGNYTVKSGDTLSALSLQFNITITDLKKLNGLTSDNIFVGQKLNVGSAASQTKPTAPSNGTAGTPVGNTNGVTASTIINNATKLLGTPYAWGGSSLSGFDCSGFIYYVFNQVGISLPRTSSSGYYSRSFYINNPQPGDLVFFADTYQSGISHLGIYLGNNQFIHAGDNGVEISSLDETYWKNHFDGFKRLYESI